MTSDHRYPPPVLPPLEAGQIIGERYLVGEVLGDGGMGIVRAGTHVLLGTPVAIKVIHSDLKDDREAVQRFVNEARVAASLKGEHIARVFDVGVLESSEPYLVMERLEGTSLDQYHAGRGTLTQAEVVDILLQVCEGLAEAHAAGLVHRDIKPANLFMTQRPDGQLVVKILDFGIAKRLDATSPALTDPGKSLGSPWYMSPEQMMAPASVDARADVWSLGVLLFELLTTRLPFEGDSVPQVCANVLAASPPRLSDYRSDLAPELDTLLLRCLEKEPAQRFPSVSDLARALAPFGSASLNTAPLAFEAISAIPSAYPRAGRRSWPLVLALVALPLLLFGAWLRYDERPIVAQAAFGASPALDRTTTSGASPSALDPPLMLQYIRTARAVSEVELGAPKPAVVWRRSRQRAPTPRGDIDDDATWLRNQELKRLRDAEERYGL